MKQMEGDGKIINSYNKLIKTINLKSKQFQEDKPMNFLPNKPEISEMAKNLILKSASLSLTTQPTKR